jgi:rubrerythrin
MGVYPTRWHQGELQEVSSRLLPNTPKKGKPMNATVVVRGRRKAIRRFRDEKVGEQFYQAAVKRFNKPGEEVHFINLTKAAAPPKDWKALHNLLWCPYCNCPREFHYSEKREVRVCPICGIGDRAYYVRLYNRLDPTPTYRRK